MYKKQVSEKGQEPLANRNVVHPEPFVALRGSNNSSMLSRTLYLRVLMEWVLLDCQQPSSQEVEEFNPSKAPRPRPSHLGVVQTYPTWVALVNGRTQTCGPFPGRLTLRQTHGSFHPACSARTTQALGATAGAGSMWRGPLDAWRCQKKESDQRHFSWAAEILRAST